MATQAWEQLLGTSGAEDIQARLAITMSQAMNNLDEDPKEVVWYAAEALRLSEACGDPVIIMAAMRFLALHQFSRGSSRASIALTREVIELARAGDHWQQLTTALLNQSLTARLRSLPEGLALGLQCSSTGRQHGMKVWQIECNIATMLWTIGQWREHEDLLRRLTEEWDAIAGPDQILMFATDVWRVGAGLSPMVPEPTGTFDELNWRSWDTHLRALQSWALGDRGKALQLARECLELTMADAGFTDDYPMQMPRMMWLALEADDREFVQAALTQLEGAPKGLEISGLRAYERTFRGLLGVREGKDVVVAEAEVRLGIAGLETLGAIPDRALAQEELGRWLVGQGRALDAAPLLEAARATYAELGATAWLERLESLSRVA